MLNVGLFSFVTKTIDEKPDRRLIFENPVGVPESSISVKYGDYISGITDLLKLSS